MNNKHQIFIGFKNLQLKQKEKKNKVHREDERKNDVLGQCVVCLEEVRMHVFVLCGRIYFCKDCCHKTKMVYNALTQVFTTARINHRCPINDYGMNPSAGSHGRNLRVPLI